MCRAHNIPEYRQDDGAIRPLTSSAEARYGAILADLRRLHSVLATEVGDSDFVSELRVDLTDLNGSERSKLAAATTDIQLTSKLWLLEELFKQVPMGGLTILVLGGWCGVLPWLARLIGRESAGVWISIDRDLTACSIGKRAFGGATSNLLFVCHDAYKFDYRRLARGCNLVVINTICEHLHDFRGWRSLLPEGAFTVLQSNNYRGCPDHINCVDLTGEFVAKAGLRQVLFQGSLALSLFTRFMVIGRT